MRRVALLTSQGDGRQRQERISPDSDVCISNGHLLAIFCYSSFDYAPVPVTVYD